MRLALSVLVLLCSALVATATLAPAALAAPAAAADAADAPEPGEESSDFYAGQGLHPAAPAPKRQEGEGPQ
jgi:hypothetical protein